MTASVLPAGLADRPAGLPDLPVGLAERFAALCSGLRGVAEPYFVAEWQTNALILLAFTRICAGARLLVGLVMRFRAGKTARRRTRGARRDREGARERSRRSARPPRDGAWLLALMPGVGAYAAPLRALVADAELPALLAAAPATRGLLRALWRMLLDDPMPAVLCEPPPAGAGVGAGTGAGAPVRDDPPRVTAGAGSAAPNAPSSPDRRPNLASRGVFDRWMSGTTHAGIGWRFAG